MSMFQEMAKLYNQFDLFFAIFLKIAKNRGRDFPEGQVCTQHSTFSRFRHAGHGMAVTAEVICGDHATVRPGLGHHGAAGAPGGGGIDQKAARSSRRRFRPQTVVRGGRG